VADISSLYFRTHTNLLLQDEVPEEHNDDDDDGVAVDTVSAHILMFHMLAACWRLASLNATTPSSRKLLSEAYQSQIAVAGVNGTLVAG
jgi:hypothetical protein